MWVTDKNTGDFSLTTICLTAIGGWSEKCDLQPVLPLITAHHPMLMWSYDSHSTITWLLFATSPASFWQAQSMQKLARRLQVAAMWYFA